MPRSLLLLLLLPLLLPLLLLLLLVAAGANGKLTFSCGDNPGTAERRLLSGLDSSHFNSSSFRDEFRPENARIDASRTRNAWCPLRQLVHRRMTEWLSFSFDWPVIVHNLLTMPLVYESAEVGKFCKMLVIQFRRSESEPYRNYSGKHLVGDRWVWRTEFKGNADLNDKRNYIMLNPPLVAQSVRLYPVNPDSGSSDVCLRLKASGCPRYAGPLAYAAPQGHGMFADATYDGVVAGGRLSGGLGQLTDHQVPDEAPQSSADAAAAFVGWQRRRLGAAEVEIDLSFGRQVSLSSVRLLAGNDWRRWGAGTFGSVQLLFSDDCRSFGGGRRRPVQQADGLLQDVRLQLPSVRAACLRLRLAFRQRAEWLLLAEISVISDEVLPAASTTPQAAGGEVRPQASGSQSSSSGSSGQSSSSGSSGQSSSSGSSGQSSSSPPAAGPHEPLDLRDSEFTYIIITASSILAGGLLLLSVLLLCLRRRQLRKKQRCLRAACGDVHLDFNSGRPAVLQAKSSLYSSLPDSEDDEDEQMAAEQRRRAAELREYATLYGVGPPPPYCAQRPRLTQNPVAQMVERGATPLARARAAHAAFASPQPQHVGVQHQGLQLLSSPPPVPRFPSDISIQGCSGNAVYASPLHPPAAAAAEEEHDADLLLLLEVPLSSLSLQERLGSGQFGEVRLALWRCEQQQQQQQQQQVAVKTLHSDASQQAREDFRREMRLLARLRDPNILGLLGVVTQQPGPQCMVMEYMQHGDLHQLLSRLPASTDSALASGCAIFLAGQVASGMKYLEQRQVVHRDLSCRNCLLGAGLRVKVSDFGMSRQLYAGCYCRLHGGARLPVRWMAWEAVLHASFSTSSDVWSFAVTLWEMLTLCRELPFAQLNDEQVVANCRHIQACDGAARPLQQPAGCPAEIYDLMCECWQRDHTCRPAFREIHLFLQRKAFGFSPQDDPLLRLLASADLHATS